MSVLSMNELTTYRWTFEEDVHRYLAAGYEGIGVWRQKLADYGVDRGIDLLSESGLKVTNVLWAGGFTGSDGRTYNESLSDAANAVRQAAAMNAGCLVIYSGGRNNHTFRHAERLFQSALSELLELAEAADVSLAIEPMHPACAADCTFLCEIETTIALIDHMRSPRLKMVFDTYHFGHDLTVLANLRELAPYVGIVHLADYSTPHDIDAGRCPLGEGQVPLDEIVRGLLEFGYEGDFDVELIGSEIELADYRELLDSSRQAFQRVHAPAVGP